MAPRGGYKKNTDPRGEYVRLDQVQDAEAKLCAAKMGQELPVWMADAVEHHLYRCEMLQAQERYRADELAAAARRYVSPDRHDRRYQVDRPKPEITQPGPGAGSAGRGPAGPR